MGVEKCVNFLICFVRQFWEDFLVLGWNTLMNFQQNLYKKYGKVSVTKCSRLSMPTFLDSQFRLWRFSEYWLRFCIIFQDFVAIFYCWFMVRNIWFQVGGIFLIFLWILFDQAFISMGRTKKNLSDESSESIRTSSTSVNNKSVSNSVSNFGSNLIGSEYPDVMVKPHNPGMERKKTNEKHLYTKTQR